MVLPSRGSNLIIPWGTLSTTATATTTTTTTTTITITTTTTTLTQTTDTQVEIPPSEPNQGGQLEPLEGAQLIMMRSTQ